jgi:predicted nucleotidyltransferase
MVWLKKYFYVLHPVLACLWIEHELGVVPMAFDDLVGGVVKGDELKSSIVKLTELKRSGAEMDNGLRIAVIHFFLEREIARLGELVAGVSRNPVSTELQAKINRYFRDTLGR